MLLQNSSVALNQIILYLVSVFLEQHYAVLQPVVYCTESNFFDSDSTPVLAENTTLRLRNIFEVLHSDSCLNSNLTAISSSKNDSGSCFSWKSQLQLYSYYGNSLRPLPHSGSSTEVPSYTPAPVHHWLQPPEILPA